MRRDIFMVVFFVAMGIQSVFATGDSLSYLVPGDTIFIQLNQLGEKVMEHRMERKQTLFSLAGFYGLKLADVYRYNPEIRTMEEVPIGFPVFLPIPNRAILRYLPEGSDFSKFVPVFYRVKKGETLYGIATKHFRMHPSEIMFRNGLSNEGIEIDQKLLVGWMNLNGIPAEYRITLNGPEAERSQELQEAFFSYGNKTYTARGVAFWDKNNRARNDLYALHGTAPVNSVIEIRNPLTSRTAYVRVVGKIPPGIHEGEIEVVLSPSAAELLGAMDNRFFVEIQHY